MNHDLNAKFERLALAFDNSSTSGIEETNGTYSLRLHAGMKAISDTEKLLKIFKESGFINEVPRLNPMKIHGEGIHIHNDSISLHIGLEGNDVKITFTPQKLDGVSMDMLEAGVKSFERITRQPANLLVRHLQPSSSGRTR